MNTRLQIKWLLPVLLLMIVWIGGGGCSNDETYEFEGKGLLLEAEPSICMDYTHILDMGKTHQVVSLDNVNYRSGEIDIYVNKCVAVYGHYINAVESDCPRVVLVEKIRELK